MVDCKQLLALAKKFNSVLFEKGGESVLSCGVRVLVDEQIAGLVWPSLLPLLRNCPLASQLFCFPSTDDDDRWIKLDPSLHSEQLRSQALDQLLLEWRNSHQLTALKGWRDEKYDVRASFSQSTLFRIERSASSLFGVLQYGVSLNGFVRHPSRGLCVWLQRRALNKPTWPGRLDNMVSGGLTSGLSVMEAVKKEAEEEASLCSLLANNISAAGCVSFFYSSERGLFPSCEFVFDIELPADFVPRPNDGEVLDFTLHEVQDVVDIMCSDEFKMSSAPVTLDFLVRHGVITPDNNPDYSELCELLHVPLQDLFLGRRTCHLPPAENMRKRAA